MRRRSIRRVLSLSFPTLVFTLACDDARLSFRCPDTPTEGLYATFRVGGESFHSSITSPQGIAEAIDLWRGDSAANIPVGDLVCEAIEWNCRWSWHQEPDSVRFAEVTTEACDGRPSDVEAACEDFPAQYCPWSAELVELRDCRTDPSCPPVSR